MESKLIWPLIIIVLIAILSSILKVKEEFRNKRKGRRNTKASTVKVKGTLKVENNNSRGKTFLKLQDNNVVVPNDASIEFGSGVNGKEINAGKIRYGGWDGGALNIVGAGGNGVNRNVRVWDRLQVGSLDVQEDGCIGYGPGKKFKFCFQTDGNVVQYKDAKPVWATGIPS